MDLDDLVNIEQRFYDEGYAEGHEHGRKHGFAEGRAMGQKVGYELWEEIGFYEGFARMWKRVAEWGTATVLGTAEGEKGKVATATGFGAKDERISQAAHSLLELIAQFPMVNPSTASAKSDSSDPANSSSKTPQREYDPEMDVVKVLGQIRSKYKMLCSLVGVKPSLRASTAAAASAADDGQEDAQGSRVSRLKQGRELPKHSAEKLWHIERGTSNRKGSPKQDAIGSLDF